MNVDPVTGSLATRLVREHVTSARPDAPVVAPRQRPVVFARGRARLADGLTRLARRIEPPVPAQSRNGMIGACAPR